MANKPGENGGPTTTAAPAARKTRAPAIPAGMKRIQFLIPDELHAKAMTAATEDDRYTVDDHARVTYLRHLRERAEKQGAAAPPQHRESH